MRRRAVTLIEVLVVISIVVTLAAITYVVARPAKESARQRHCMSNFKTLYGAAQIYDIDNPASDRLSAALGMNARPFSDPQVLSRLVNNQSLFYCPDTPECAKKRIASTYSWNLLGPLEPKNDAERMRFRDVCERVESEQGNVVVVTCYVHQEMFYDPRRTISEKLEAPFVIQLFADGHIEHGRKPVMRQRVIEGLCE